MGFYKLAERGEFMLPMYLVDKGIPLARMSLLTGLFRSLASVVGSCFGGYLLSYRGMDPVIVLRWSAWTRCIPLLLHLMFVGIWGPTPVDPVVLDVISWNTFLLYCTATSMILSATIAGLLTTSCFTL